LKPGADGHNHVVVAALPEGLAFFLAHTDDGVHVAVDLDLFAQGIGSGHQVLADVLPDNYHLRRVVFVVVVQRPSHDNVEVINRLHGRSPAAHNRIRAVLGAVDHLAGKIANRRAHYLAGRALVDDGLVVLHVDVFALVALNKGVGIGNDIGHLAND